MGNKVCCEETRTQNNMLEQVQPEVSNRSRLESERQAVPNQSMQPVGGYANQYSPQQSYEQNEEYISTPELSQRAQTRLNDERFFYNELNGQTNPSTKRYGEDVYVGQLDERRHKPHGLGRMYKPNGSIYIGYFEHGRAEGRGVYIFEDGSYYEGEFHNNSAQTEKGKYVSDQLTYSGGFRNNTFDGQAYEEGRDYKFVGWYMNGSRQKGTLTWQVDGKEYRYEGEFNSLNQFHGNGTLQEPTGVYEGQFLSGDKEGQGVYRSENGTRYEGQYNNGYREGYGTIYNGDNTIAYKGEMQGGLPHGAGSVYKNGKELKTTWVEGIDQNLLPDRRQ